MAMAIRFIGTFFVLFFIYRDTQSLWVTASFAAVFISIEIHTWMFRHLSKQAKYLEGILDEIKELVK